MYEMQHNVDRHRISGGFVRLLMLAAMMFSLSLPETTVQLSVFAVFTHVATYASPV